MGGSHQTAWTPGLYDFLRDRDGATIIEYALLVALIGGALIGTFESFTDEADGMFGFVGDKLEANEAK